MTEIHTFGEEPISCHAFNGDRTSEYPVHVFDL